MAEIRQIVDEIVVVARVLVGAMSEDSLGAPRQFMAVPLANSVLVWLHYSFSLERGDSQSYLQQYGLD